MFQKTRWLSLSLMLGGALLVGCNNFTSDDRRTPEQAAQEALGMQADDKERTVEETKKVDVIQETKVVDRETGQVLSSEREVTPVTVTKEKEVETDVDVKVGDTVERAPRP